MPSLLREAIATRVTGWRPLLVGWRPLLLNVWVKDVFLFFEADGSGCFCSEPLRVRRRGESSFGALREFSIAPGVSEVLASRCFLKQTLEVTKPN